MTKDQVLEKFMRESNAIEGELEYLPFVNPGGWPVQRGRLNNGDITACKEFLKLKKLDIDAILDLHARLGKYLKQEWVGRFRLCNVRVGSYLAPDWREVPELMKKYMEEFPSMPSWKAHNEFEKIHPFQDLNGRTGRLLWLWKARNEQYNFSIPFLQAYYYQTLNRYESMSKMSEYYWDK